MPSILTLEGAGRGRARRSGGDPKIGDFKCVYNPRTKQRRKLVYVGKKPGKRGSGWVFKKGDC